MRLWHDANRRDLEGAKLSAPSCSLLIEDLLSTAHEDRPVISLVMQHCPYAGLCSGDVRVWSWQDGA